MSDEQKCHIDQYLNRCYRLLVEIAAPHLTDEIKQIDTLYELEQGKCHTRRLSQKIGTLIGKNKDY